MGNGQLTKVDWARDYCGRMREILPTNPELVGVVVKSDSGSRVLEGQPCGVDLCGGRKLSCYGSLKLAKLVSSYDGYLSIVVCTRILLKSGLGNDACF